MLRVVAVVYYYFTSSKIILITLSFKDVVFILLEPGSSLSVK